MYQTPPHKSPLLLVSFFVILFCPLIVLVTSLWILELPATQGQVELFDVLGESLLLILVQFWIISIAFAHLRSVTFNYLLSGFGIITLANTADLLDEFLIDQYDFLNLLENSAYPLGMAIATVGLFKLSRDHRKLIQQVNIDRDNWRDKARVDQLTGLFNRRYFFDWAREQVRLVKDSEKTLSFLMLDIDHFKSVNDNFGHDMGDQVLSQVGKCLIEFCRHNDKSFRLGGEEFCVVMAEADHDAVMQASMRLKQRLGVIQLKSASGELVSRTVSIGVSHLQANDSLETLLKRADDALYLAKSRGRNCVVANS